MGGGWKQVTPCDLTGHAALLLAPLEALHCVTTASCQYYNMTCTFACCAFQGFVVISKSPSANVKLNQRYRANVF